MKLRNYSSKQVILFLKSRGFVLHHKKGSHNILIKRGVCRVVVPERKEIAIGTLRAILRESNISNLEIIEFFEKKSVKRRRRQNE